MGDQVNVRLPPEVVEEVEQEARKQGYMSRSEFIRDSIRDRLHREGF